MPSLHIKAFKSQLQDKSAHCRRGIHEKGVEDRGLPVAGGGVLSE